MKYIHYNIHGSALICCYVLSFDWINTLQPRQDDRHFTDDIFKLFFLKEDVWIYLNISLKCVSRAPVHNIPSLVEIMTWRLPGDKPLSQPMMVSLLTPICVTRPHWVNAIHGAPFCTAVSLQLIPVRSGISCHQAYVSANKPPLRYLRPRCELFCSVCVTIDEMFRWFNSVCLWWCYCSYLSCIVFR